ncbi:helix-turn-helix transcriptional regulator [Nocardia sp. NPDC005998]|uniref:helix-turn-helix transcriptional regulator n=1 Tax=Nocardia sp. NPDC005998 TaxID=3156894 RepID=UPI0033A8A1B9
MLDNELGQFLRARRASLRPDDVGVISHGMRRVSGLRREEVAVLAGMNADYYTRLEQGRERHPSPQILDALSQAMRLDTDARTHLYRLAGAVPSGRTTTTTDQVSPAMRQLIDGYPLGAAFVVNRALDILAANTLTQALYSPFTRADNLARMTFLDPAARQFYTRWGQTAEATVANLRHAVGLDPNNPRLRATIRILTEQSPEFTRLWNTHNVRGKTHEAKHFLHPDVGPLALTYQALDIPDALGQQLVVYHAEPDSPTAQALKLLGSLHATRDHTPNT